MTKKYLSFLLLSALLVSLLSGCTSDNIKSENTISQEALPDASSQDIENLIDVTLNEVAHSIFYAPMYVAVENDYFAEEGINLEIVCGFGADKVMTALLSGEADIGFMGPESSIYTFNEGANDYVINFAQLTQRAGNFLVSREKITDFSWDDLKGSYVLGGRKGGMPQMVFEYILKQNGLDPSTDLEINQNIDFGSTAAAFSGGQGDYTVELHNLILQKTISELRTTCNVYLFINCLLRMSEAYSDRTSPHYSFFAITFLKMSIKNTTHF